MPQYTFDGANNLENEGTTLTTLVASGTTAPFIMHVANATVFSFATLPILLTLAPANDSEAAACETFRVSALDTVTNQLSISARGINGSPNATWPIGSLVEARLSGAHITELQTSINDVAQYADSSAALEYLNFSDQYQNYP